MLEKITPELWFKVSYYNILTPNWLISYPLIRNIINEQMIMQK